MSKNTVYGNSVEIFDLKSRVDHLEKLMDASGHGKGYHSMNESKSIGHGENKTMKEIKCPSCGSSDDYDIKGLVRFECTNCLRIYDIPVDNDWKDLDIKDIPSDFFVNEGYEIQYYNETNEAWSIRIDKTALQVIHSILDYPESKYRYRLKPLESMKINSNLYSFMFDEHEKLQEYCKLTYEGSRISSIDGQKIVIIKS